jgi:pimeloyl-ACP methyl ester carboxylesterase
MYKAGMATIQENAMKYLCMVFWEAVAVFTLTACGSVLAQSSAKEQIIPAVAGLGKGFVSKSAKVNGTTIHYVRGGTGPAVILVHGFPQDWFEFHRIMPRLAKQFTVVAVDLRGVGGSAATTGGYDAANLAEDIHQLALQLELERVYVVGHDIGGMVAYAFARRYPETTRGVMILDVPLPGIEPWDEIQSDPSVWHIRFHQVPNLAEKLVVGRQVDYFRYFLSRGFSDADVAHFANSYAAPEHLRAAFEFYRAFPDNEVFNAAQRGALDIPLVYGAGESSPFAKIIPRTAESLRAHGCAMVETLLIKNSAHYVFDQQPETVAELIERHASL